MVIKSSGRVGINNTNPSYTLHCNGSFAASSKSFDIPHPDPSKEGFRLRHACIETPSCGGVQYKYQFTCVKGANEFPLPSYIQHLAVDLMCFCSPYKCFGQAWAEVIGSTLHVNCSKAMITNVLIFGDRCDKDAMECAGPTEYEEEKEEEEEEEEEEKEEEEEEEEPLATTTTDEEEPL